MFNLVFLFICPSELSYKGFLFYKMHSYMYQEVLFRLTTYTFNLYLNL